MDGNCQTCRWWDTSVADAVDGSLSPCRVRPPVVQINVSRGVWPMVDADDWCSNHSPRPPVALAPTTYPADHIDQPGCTCTECIPF